MISAKQKAVLRLISLGESDESVRAELNLNPEAFSNCLDQLFRELGVTTRVELIFFACSEEGKLLLEDEAA
jgi:DNA-binding NarL/FixJ family response regulator